MSKEIANQFFQIEVGSWVTDGNKTYRVTHVLSITAVLATDLATGDSKRLHIEELTLIPEPSQDEQTDEYADASAYQDVLGYTDEQWKEGQHRLAAIKELLDNPIRTRNDAERIAAQQGIHCVTLYRWLSAYLKSRHVSALVPKKRGKKTGTVSLEPPIEAILQSVIEDYYLHKQKRTPADAIEEVQRRCRVAKVPAPHPNTIRRRLDRIPDKILLRRRGRKDLARDRYAPIRGEFPNADHPFSVVQIDHTLADIIVVDEAHRQPIGRPWLTLAIDVNTRMLAGLYVSFDPPSAASVGLCLAQAMCPKREYLAELGVPGEWPVWGRIARVHCDNGKDFRSRAVERGCEENDIQITWRPVKVPNYGGHIERYMGISATEIHKLPGTTFSNIEDRKGYNSEAQSAMTLKEFERHLVDFFVNIYHQRKHATLGIPPILKWEHGIVGNDHQPGAGLMAVPKDPQRLAIEFMPFEERTVQRYGLQLDKITYYDPVLDPYIRAVELDSKDRNRKFIIRRDPRDISQVYFLDPATGQYFPIPYRNIGHPAISLYELREIRRGLREAGVTEVDEDKIFEAMARMRERVDESVAKTKAARRQAARRPKRITSPPPSETSHASPNHTAFVTTHESVSPHNDIFSMPVELFDADELKD